MGKKLALFVLLCALSVLQSEGFRKDVKDLNDVKEVIKLASDADESETSSTSRSSRFLVKAATWYMWSCSDRIWAKDELSFEVKLTIEGQAQPWTHTEKFYTVRGLLTQATPNWKQEFTLTDVPTDEDVTEMQVSIRVTQSSHLWLPFKGWVSYDCGGWQDEKVAVSAGGHDFAFYQRTAEFPMGGARIRVESLDRAPTEPIAMQAPARAEQVQAKPEPDPAQPFQRQSSMSETDNEFCAQCALSLCDATDLANSMEELSLAFKDVCETQKCESCPEETWPQCRGSPAGCSGPTKNDMVRPLISGFSADLEQAVQQKKADRTAHEKGAETHCFHMESQKSCGMKKGEVKDEGDWKVCKASCDAKSKTAPTGFQCVTQAAEFHFMKPGAGMVKDCVLNPQAWLSKYGQGTLPEECELAWQLCDTSDPGCQRGAKGYNFIRGVTCVAVPDTAEVSE